MRKPGESARLTWQGQSLGQHAGTSTFAEQMLVHENAVVKVDEDIPLDRAALVGCGVTTGVGAVLNTAKIEAGSTVAVFGMGGVGLSAIQGARIGGARQIIAVDVLEHKLSRRDQLGATHTVNATDGDPVEAIRDLTGGGVDYAFEAIGLKQTGRAGVRAASPSSGTATVIGLMPVGRDDRARGPHPFRARSPGQHDGLEPLPHRHAEVPRVLPARAV